MTKTPLLLVPGLLCSPRLYGPQVAGLGDIADIVVPDWRKAPLAIFDTWEKTARWVVGTPEEVEKFREANRGQIAEDRDGAPVFLAKSAWELGYVGGKFPNVRFLKTRERAAAAEAA